VGVEAVAEAAETNKMTLYRHFSSKDELVAGYLQRLAEKAKLSWDRLEADHSYWKMGRAAPLSTGRDACFIVPGVGTHVDQDQCEPWTLGP